MNNVISVSETELAVSAFLKSINVSFKAVSVGMRKDKDWKGDQFHITLSRSNNGARMTSDYTTGTGHRIIRKNGLTSQDKKALASDNLSVTLLAQSDWSNDDCRIANKLGAPAFCRVFAVSPNAAGVLYCLISDASLGNETHADFCANLDYSEDSRKGLESYLACQKVSNELNAFFTYEEREKLNELLEDY